ncbi:hypothetical protein ACEPAI_7869 [Sanghuangporus weigelae]
MDASGSCYCCNMIRLATFDALLTVLRPRQPIHVQYAEVFAPFFGHLSPDAVKSAFKIALKELQTSRPAYADGPESWWAAVISRTALGAGARESDVNEHIGTVVPKLLRRFSSREGYALYDDTIPTLKTLHEMGVRTALVTNCDSRILQALDDLEALKFFDPILASDLEGVEKPQREIFLHACERAGVKPSEVVHVGDELECDYHGATRAGLNALLLCRPSEDPMVDEDLAIRMDEKIKRISSLDEVVQFVREHNV